MLACGLVDSCRPGDSWHGCSARSAGAASEYEAQTWAQWPSGHRGVCRKLRWCGALWSEHSSADWSFGQHASCSCLYFIIFFADQDKTDQFGRIYVNISQKDAEPHVIKVLPERLQHQGGWFKSGWCVLFAFSVQITNPPHRLRALETVLATQGSHTVQWVSSVQKAPGEDPYEQIPSWMPHGREVTDPLGASFWSSSGIRTGFPGTGDMVEL